MKKLLISLLILIPTITFALTVNDNVQVNGNLTVKDVLRVDKSISWPQTGATFMDVDNLFRNDGTLLMNKDGEIYHAGGGGGLLADMFGTLFGRNLQVSSGATHVNSIVCYRVGGLLGNWNINTGLCDPN